MATRKKKIATEQNFYTAKFTHPITLNGKRVIVTDEITLTKSGDKYYTLEGEEYNNPSATIVEK